MLLSLVHCCLVNTWPSIASVHHATVSNITLYDVYFLSMQYY